jgi:cytochrome oxidase assembly protein ShyY1
MLRRLPVVSTIVVLIAVGIMIRLGFWQLDRLHQKEAMLADYAAARNKPPIGDAGEGMLRLEPYRRVTLDCRSASSDRLVAGHNRAGTTGWAHRFTCTTGRYDVISEVVVTIGWSQAPQPVVWGGGYVSGVAVPAGKDGLRVVADPPLDGLQANEAPDPANIPNNHMSYAVQWFLFAGVALVIYALAVRKRLAGEAPPR